MAKRVGIFAFDPGGTTGVAWGLLDCYDTVSETLQKGTVHSQDVTGTYQEQARKLNDMLVSLRYLWTVEMGLPASDVHVVSEGFSLSKIGSRAKVGLYPVWISAMFEGLVDETETVDYQEPSQKVFAKSERLKRWGVWEVGVSEHRRDAVRHLAIKLNRLL